MRRVGDFIPMETEIKREVHELAAGSSKRDVEEELDQGSSKRQKTSENSELVEESKEKEDDELSQEELQQLMTIVPEEGMNVIIQRFNSTDPTEDKEIKLWVELKRLFEPDVDDELWKSQKHVHDITWILYDTCGVHHVSTKDGIDIYMLVEKEYPLSRGVLTQMLAAKLLMEQNNEMCRELLRKIFMMAERPRRITTARRVSTIRRIKTRERIKMKIVYQDYLRDKIEQYFQVQDYALWDVIENGNSFKPAAKTTTNVDGTSTTLITCPVTTEEKVQKKNDMKARSMLLMALLNEHLMTFNQYKDAKTLFAVNPT
ncbi:hypothetical protein Tco_0188759 [Tanacetum coccineum]